MPSGAARNFDDNKRVGEELPQGDQRSFEAVRIPNLSVSIVPHDDVPLLVAAVPAMRHLQRAETRPVTAETIHNGPRDTIAVIEQAAMQAVPEWIDAMVGALSSTSTV